MEWISALQELPREQAEIMFICDDDSVKERLGYCLPDEGVVLLHHSEMKYKHLRWWFYIPEMPWKRQ